MSLKIVDAKKRLKYLDIKKNPQKNVIDFLSKNADLNDRGSLLPNESSFQPSNPPTDD